MQKDFNSHTIAFIGAGNMSRSIIGAMVGNGYPAANITAANPSMAKLDALAADFAINISRDNLTAIKNADMVVLGVKPQMLATVCHQLAQSGLDLSGKLFVSLVAGVICERIQTLLGQKVALIRCMPNTPALYGKGISGLYCHGADQAQCDLTDHVMQASGLVVWVESESQIDAITAVSGSGPAYFFAFMEAMVAKAQQLGFDPDTAKQLVQHTAMGAATMVANADESISQLRQNVTSKNGTTAAALEVFEQQGLATMVANAMQSCNDRAKELAKNL